MKNFIITIVLLSAILILSLTACLSSTNLLRPADPFTATHKLVYAITTKVVWMDRETDVVWCEDYNGNLWEFYGCEDWCINDIACLLMNDNGTENIYDDEVMSIRYQGTFEGWR